MQLAPNNPKPGSKASAVAVGAQKVESPRLVDLGADKCVPCKMMAPVLEELRKEHKGKLRVEFIDVWKNRDAAQRYRIKSIPTQVFYDGNGREFGRHEGFISKEDILKVFSNRGITFDKE